MIASTRALLIYPGLSFSSRTGPSRCLGAAAWPLPGLPDAPPRRPRGKGRSQAEPLVPRTPYPSAAAPDLQKKEVDHQSVHWIRPAFLGSQTRLFAGRPQNLHLPWQATLVYLTTQLPTPSSKSVAKITNPSLTQTCR